MRHFLLLLALLVLAGCSSPTGTPAPPELRVSADLPVEYQAAAVRAVELWGAAVSVSIVPEAEANFTAGDCLEPAAYGCAWPHELVLVDLERMAECRWATVDGLTVCAKMPVDFLALHEIGHWLGIEEHAPEGHVMQPALTIPMPVAVPTPTDLELLANAH